MNQPLSTPPMSLRPPPYPASTHRAMVFSPAVALAVVELQDAAERLEAAMLRDGTATIVPPARAAR